MLNRLSAWFGTKPKAMESDNVKLPPDLPNWSLVKELLQDLQVRLNNENISEQETGWFMQTIYNTIQSERQVFGSRDGQLDRLRLQIQSNLKKKLDSSSLWFGMLKYLRKISSDERDRFLYLTLPNIIEFALGIEYQRPKEPLNISKQQHGGATKLSRQFICSIVACFFLCLFPERKKESSKLNIVNFAIFFKHLPHAAQIAKLRCILHYFECVIERGMELHGNILFCRKVAMPKWMLTFDELVQCDMKLCPLYIQPQGTIEDSSAEAIQVCFGNKSVGGGVLGRSVVQEEIRFSTCPELMAAMLFLENMATNEAILVSGYEQFSSYNGYGDSLEFAGHYSGPDQVHTMVTIDATSYRDIPFSKQFEEKSILRDLNKAVIGFSWMPGTDGGAVQQWEVGGGDDSPVAADVAADIVANAMTDALRQAAESPVDPEAHQPPYQHLNHQTHLSYNQCHQEQALQLSEEDSSLRSTTSLQATHLQHLPLTTEYAAESLYPEQDISDSTGPCSGRLQAAQSSSSSSLSVNVTIDSSLVSQPQSYAHSTSEPPTSSGSAQTFFPSSHTQQHQLLGQPNKCQLSSAVDQPSFSLDSTSNRASDMSGHLGDAAESSALIRDSSISQSRLTTSDSSRILVSDILGNLSRNAMPSAGVSSVDISLNKDCKLLHSTGQTELSDLHQEHHTTADIVIDVQVASQDSASDTSSYSLPLKVGMEQTKFNEPVLPQSVKTLTEDKYDIVNSIDVVLSLPALHTELERVSSGLSNSSMFVSVGSQSMSANSAEEENTRQPVTDVLNINVEHSGLPLGTWRYSRDKIISDTGASSIDSMFLEPPFSSSPQSSVSSANISPNTSFIAPESTYLEPPNGLSDGHLSADFLEGLHSQAQHSSRRGSRDFYGELRDFLSSSSSGSRGSGSGGPLSSTNSSWGSRSGSISSHGTNGSTIDFLEFWSHFRRRSSQLSDTMSRRSSSSKHSSDFSTDLEEISEGVQKHNHGVIEEEGSLMSLVADFASHFVSVVVRDGLAVGAHLTSTDKHTKDVDEMSRSLENASKASFDICQPQPSADVEVNDSIDHTIFPPETVAAKTDISVLPASNKEGIEETAVSRPSGKELSSATQQCFIDEGNSSDPNELVLQSGPSSNLASSGLSPAKAVIKLKTVSRTYASPGLSSPAITRCHEPNTSLRGHQLEGQPSSVYSLDSGFSSAISSINLTTQLPPVEPCNEETSALSSMNTTLTQHECSDSSIVNSTTYPVLNEAVPQITTQQYQPETSSAKRLEHKNHAQESTTVKQSIPNLKADDKTLYATLESKTICSGHTNVPQSTSLLQQERHIEQMQLELTSSEASAAFIPLHPLLHEQHTEISEIIEPAETNLLVAKSDPKLLKSSSTGATNVLGRGLKYFRRQKAEEEISTHLEVQAGKKSDASEASRAAEVKTTASNSSLHGVHHSLNDASAPSKSSLIPKLKDSIKRISGCSESLLPVGSKSKSPQKHISLTAKDRQKADDERIQRDNISFHRKTEKILLKPHRSRYIFSDVAAAPSSSKRRKAKAPADSEAFVKRQSEKKALKRQDEKKRKQKNDSSRHGLINFTTSPRFIRFVSSIAEMSVSQAVLEGADILTQSSGGHRGISDELYNWFATKIVTEVFLYVVNELDMQQSSHHADISQPSVSDPADDNSVSEGCQSPNACKNEISESADVKPKGILPTKSDSHASSPKALGHQLRPSGSLKVVKFKDSRVEKNSSSALSHLQTHVTMPNSSKTNATPTFHRHSSNIPVPLRWRSSLDLPSLSPPGVHTTSLSSSSKSPLTSRPTHESHAFAASHASLTSRDLSINVYQAAATIVSQVLQAVSDRLDTRTLIPVSSGRPDTASSSDTAIHSTGSRIHSHYNSIASNIFSSSSVKVSDSPKRALRPVSPSIGVFSRKPMSRETLTNAFLKVDSTPSIKSYERRSSEPCQTSVQLSLQAFNSIKFSQQAVEDKHRNISRTDDDIGRGKTWRRGSLDGFSFERRTSCGFKDPVLSRFAEELMKADTSVPELVIVGSHPGSSSTGSRRSSICAYKEAAQANFESDMLNTSFTSVCSLPMSHSSHSQCRRTYMDRSHSRESRNWKSDSSDTEYWFPPPKIVGDEFQQEYNKQHSQEELQDYASFFAGRVVQEAVCVLKCDPAYLSREEQGVELFAENLMDQIMRDVMLATIHDNNNHSHLVSNHKERSNRKQKQPSAHHEGSSLKSDNSDNKSKVYYVQGARPKTSMPVLTRSKTKTAPHRGGNHQPDYQRTDNSITRHAGGHIERKTSTVSAHERLVSPSQQTSYPHSHQRATSSEGSAQDSSFRYSVQDHTADLRPTPSRLKKHSTPAGSVLPSASLLPTLSHSSIPPLTCCHRVQPGTSQSHHHAPEKHVSRTRSKLESASTAASSIPMYKGSLSCESAQLKIVSKTQRVESRASSASSVSSYHSEQTESSLPSSSGSESMDTSGKDHASRKQRTSREKASQKLSSKLPTEHKERSRRRVYYARRADTGHSMRRSGRALESEHSMEQCPIIDQFATSLSIAVMDNALLHCRDNRWLRFLSYHKPIATGNWGCGAYRGNVQLKLVIQWIAASVGQAPSLMYYTFNDVRLVQAQEIADIISGQTVGNLAAALRDYCNWVHLYLASVSTSFFSPSTRSQKSSMQTGASHSAWKNEHESLLPQTLFDFLLEKFQV